MASINKLKIGQLLYKTFKSKMGNTKMSTTRIYVYKVMDVDPVNKLTTLYSMNSYRTKTYKEMAKNLI